MIETGKYAYNFDFEVMHKYFIEEFKPFINDRQYNNCLEIGSYKGDFTKRLSSYFCQVVAIEPSVEFIAEAQKKELQNVIWMNDTFENTNIQIKFRTIFITHLLEHIEKQLFFLKKASNLLTTDGLMIICCPNANAASRQIAVNMGLIESPTCVTPIEWKHGHKRTYTLDSLTRDVKTVGLQVVHRGGILFKGLCSSQFDKAIEHGIVNDEYFMGCYELGKKYPDLCSSIYVICKK